MTTDTQPRFKVAYMSDPGILDDDSNPITTTSPWYVSDTHYILSELQGVPHWKPKPYPIIFTATREGAQKLADAMNLWDQDIKSEVQEDER